jgi:hypothetical protein
MLAKKTSKNQLMLSREIVKELPMHRILGMNDNAGRNRHGQHNGGDLAQSGHGWILERISEKTQIHVVWMPKI